MISFSDLHWLLMLLGKSLVHFQMMAEIALEETLQNKNQLSFIFIAIAHVNMYTTYLMLVL